MCERFVVLRKAAFQGWRSFLAYPWLPAVICLRLYSLRYGSAGIKTPVAAQLGYFAGACAVRCEWVTAVWLC